MKTTTLTSIGLAFFTLFAAPAAGADPVSTNEIACTKGGAEACFYAAADYANGENGMPLSKPKAADLFIKACDLGIPDGCFYTGTMYRHGVEGISADPARGIALHEKACTMGHEDACNATYAILGSDEKGEKDIPRLLTAFEKGCTNESRKRAAGARPSSMMASTENTRTSSISFAARHSRQRPAKRSIPIIVIRQSTCMPIHPPRLSMRPRR